jgi:formate dehydrogenase iron-sulfur subunit
MQWHGRLKRHRRAGDRIRSARPRRAGFPTGIKWKTVLEAAGPQKYIICNADEGDSGTFADRMIMEGDPFVLIEGMAIAGIATGATKGLRLSALGISPRHPCDEPRRRIARENKACSARRFWAPAHAFDMEIRVGAGAYVCGEETALLESLEGRRGVVRAKPPLPAHKGFLGRPTVVNNVISLASVPIIMDKGADFTAISAWAARAARSRSRLPATSSMAGCSRRPSA